MPPRNDRDLQDAQARIDAGDLASIPAIRACIVAMANNKKPPDDAVAALIGIEKDRTVQKNRRHSAVGDPPSEVDPDWINPPGPPGQQQAGGH